MVKSGVAGSFCAGADLKVRMLPVCMSLEHMPTPALPVNICLGAGHVPIEQVGPLLYTSACSCLHDT